MAKRKDPNQLAPGDVLHFARSSKKQYPLTHGTSNEYRASIPLVKTRLVFTDVRKPFAGEEYKVEGLLQPLSGTADSNGVVELELPIHLREVRIVFPKRGQVFLVQLKLSDDGKASVRRSAAPARPLLGSLVRRTRSRSQQLRLTLAIGQ